MIDDADLWDFMMDGSFDVLFPDDENASYMCPFCGTIINGGDEVVWIDRENSIFKCPVCEKNIEMN